MKTKVKNGKAKASRESVPVLQEATTAGVDRSGQADAQASKAPSAESGLKRWASEMIELLNTRKKDGYEDPPQDVIDGLFGIPDTNANFFDTAELIKRIAADWGSDEHLARYEDPKLLLQLGTIFRRAPGLANAVAWLEKALALAEKQYGADDALTVSAMERLSCVYPVEGRLDEAGNLSRRVLEFRRKTEGELSPSTFWPLMNQADNHFQLGDDAEVIPLLKEAQKVLQAYPYAFIDDFYNVVDALAALKDQGFGSLVDTASEILDETMDKMDGIIAKADSREAADTLELMAENTDDCEKAVSRYANALRIRECLDGRQDHANRRLLEGLSSQLFDAERYDEAIPYLERLLVEPTGEQALGQKWSLIGHLQRLSQCYEKSGRHQDAARCAQKYDKLMVEVHARPAPLARS